MESIMDARTDGIIGFLESTIACISVCLEPRSGVAVALLSASAAPAAFSRKASTFTHPGVSFYIQLCRQHRACCSKTCSMLQQVEGAEQVQGADLQQGHGGAT